LILYALVRFDDEETIYYGYNLFVEETLDSELQIRVNAQGEIQGIDTNILKQTMECALTYQAQNGEDVNILDILERLMSIYNDLNSEYQAYVLRAIGAVYTSSELTEKSLEFILKSGSVRDQDKLRGLYSLRRCYGREQTWKYLVDEGIWDELSIVYGSGFSAQSLAEIANTFSSLGYYQNVYEFFYESDGRITSGNARSVNQTLENIQVRTEWIENNYDDIGNYLMTMVQTTPSPVDEDDGVAAKSDDPLKYFLIGLIVFVVLVFLLYGLRLCWKWKLSKSKFLTGYKRHLDKNDDKATMINDDGNNYAVNMNSLTLADGGHSDDDKL